MTILGLEKTLYLHRKMEKRRIFTTDKKKWSNYLLFKSYVNNTPVKNRLFTVDLQHCTSIPTGIW